jgi:hypothetical protein
MQEQESLYVLREKEALTWTVFPSAMVDQWHKTVCRAKRQNHATAYFSSKPHQQNPFLIQTSTFIFQIQTAAATYRVSAGQDRIGLFNASVN